MLMDCEYNRHMAHFKIFMPNCGADGVILLIDPTGYVVEFRGRPYHEWDENEDSPMYRLHCMFVRVDISRLHSEQIETVTSWHPEFTSISEMFHGTL